MIVTMDTNILVAALFSQSGASHQILRLITDERINLALSTQIILEYDDVLKRKEIIKKSKLSLDQVNEILDLLVALAHRHAIYFRLRPNLIDEKDNLFIECAFASNSDFLITSNIKDFNNGELKGFAYQVLTPKDFYQFWKKNYE